MQMIDSLLSSDIEPLFCLPKVLAGGGYWRSTRATMFSTCWTIVSVAHFDFRAIALNVVCGQLNFI